MTEKPEPHSNSDTDDRSRRLMSLSFIGLLLTQFLTAINDNAFRWLAVGIGKDYVEPSQVGTILTAGTACFVVPYLVLASPAGYLADRFSKTHVIIGCKIAELVIMALGVCAIAADLPAKWNVILLFVVVGLMELKSPCSPRPRWAASLNCCTPRRSRERTDCSAWQPFPQR